MKILVDENLPLRLAKQIVDLFPNVDHASNPGLRSKPDSEIWRFALSQGYAAISTKEIVALLRREAVRIHEFLASRRNLLILRREVALRRKPQEP